MHYTISKNAAEAANMDDHKMGTSSSKTYVPGHDIGEGWTRHLVQLDMGDTADNPASTKGPLHGPGFVVYDCHRTGISVREFDSPDDFYNGMRSTQLLVQAIDSGQLKGTIVGQEIANFLTNSGVEFEAKV
jgi:hypothetical protein